MANDTDRDIRGQAKDAAKPAAAPKARKKRTGRWRLLSVLAMFAVVLWMLPTIVAKTPLFPWILKLATTDLNGSISVNSVSLGWLSPIRVRGIEVTDAKGKTALSIGSIVGDRRLAAILLNYSKLGKFTLTDTKLTVAMRDDGTNLEDMLAKYLVPKEEPSTTAIALAVDVPDAQVSILDEPTGLEWQVRKFSLAFAMEGGADGTMSVDVATDVSDAQGAGKLSAGVKMGPAENTAKVSATQFPLAMLRAMAARFAPGTTLRGRLSSEVAVSWGNKTAGKNGVAATLDVDGLAVAARALKTDVLQLASLKAECQATWQSDRLDIQKSSIVCDCGNAVLAGTIPLGGKDSLSLTAVAHQRQEFSGVVDLARLAQMLPATLSLRQQLRIDSGQVQWAFSSQPEAQGTVWHGEVKSASLIATDTAANRQIAWEKPIVAVLDAHDVAGGEPIVDRLLCDSDFLHVEGAGTTDNLTAKFTLSLDRLAAQLRQFVDMGALQLGGDGAGNLTWRRSQQQAFDAAANLEFRGFQLGMAGQPLWREETLQVAASAKGQTNFDVNTRIDTAALNVTSGYDQIDAALSEPVKDMKAGGIWPVTVKMRGQLKNWPARLAAWFPMNNVELAGGYAVEAAGVASQQGADVRQLRFAAVPLIVNTPWVHVNEARTEGSASGSWNQKQRRLQLPLAELKCFSAAADGKTLQPDVVVNAKSVVVALPSGAPMELAGAVEYAGDAGLIRQWFDDPRVPSPWRLAGQLKGSAVFQQTAGVVHGTTTAELANLAVIDSTGKQFQEPIIRLVAQGDYETQAKTLKLTQCELTSNCVTAAVAGNMATVDGRNNAQLDGMLNYDLERLSALLRPCIGSNVNVTGRGSSSLSYRGPFSLAEGTAAATLRWQGANLYGFPLGPADLKATMAGGAAQLEPLDVALSGGTVRLAPRVQLTSNPMVLSVPKGPLATRVQINPAMCGSALKYIAPALADAATAKGTFSIDLDDCRIPIGNMKKANIKGRFTVHSIEIGPGPMIRELAVFMSRAAPAQLKKESVVPFQMADGRVSHKNLELIFPDITIRTSGWVDLNQRMEITALMPVPQKWQAGTTVLANAVKNQTITVPLRGTLTKPALDQKVVANLSAQFMKTAASNIIEGEFNRLLTPRK